MVKILAVNLTKRVIVENLLLAQLRDTTAGYVRTNRVWGALKWIETNSFYDDVCGRRHGYLYPQDQLRQSWSDGDHKDDTEIIFFTDELKNRDETLGYWFYSKYLEPAAEIKLRLYVFPLVVVRVCYGWMMRRLRLYIWARVRTQRWAVFWLTTGLIFCGWLQ